VAAALFEAGSQGVQFDGGTVVTHFPPGTDLERVRDAVRRADAGADLHAAPADTTDWTEAWKKLIRGTRSGLSRSRRPGSPRAPTRRTRS
jgi:ribosomal protein L11 methyltransferase